MQSINATISPTTRTSDQGATRSYKNYDERWTAVVNKDANADGKFLYSVKTTHVYCRPSCPSRLALQKNVAFHLTCEGAETAGFRACKRCQPNGLGLREEQAKAVAKACALIEASEELPDLETLAKAAGFSRFYFHRVFKRIAGLTPKAFAQARRAQRIRDALPKRSTVTEAIYEAGFNSNGRFYAESSQMLGMKPSHFRQGGKNESIRFAVGECSLGSFLVGSSEKGVCAISLGGDPHQLVKEFQDRFPRAQLVGNDCAFEQMVAQVVGFIEAPKTGLALPLDLRGTAFQERVWQALRAIPVGTTVSYAQVAKHIGRPRAVRAVAGACASNTVAVAIPCHRVLRTDGNLSGYRWGVERKRQLLKREQANA